jgi:hypothetical protein
MIILHIVWTVGLYIMWLRAYMITNKRGRGKEDVAGEHRAIFELAAAMQEQMKEPTKEEGVEVYTFTESELRRRITKELRGGSISYTTPLLPNREGRARWNIRAWRNVKAWTKNHKLSILAIITCIAVMLLDLLTVGTVVLMVLPAELVLALYIGSTRKSRMVLLVWIFILVTVPMKVVIG